MKVASSFRSATTFLGYISIYTGVHLDDPCGAVYIAYVSSGIPLI